MKRAQSSWDPFWFYDQVRNKGPWDYKQRGGEYEDYGNFHYGATAKAVGFPTKSSNEWPVGRSNGPELLARISGIR